MVVVMSFGLKHGPAPEGFRLFDCRGFPSLRSSRCSRASMKMWRFLHWRQGPA